MTYRKEAASSTHISRRAITHLFWGIYPYKAETTFPAKGFKPLDSLKPFAFRSDSKRYRKKISNFRQACMKSAPKDKTTWKLYETTSSLHFYFLNKTDLETFIAGNQNRIRAIYEPDDSEQVRLLSSAGTNSFLRHTLYYDKYRYCIVFRSLPAVNRIEIDNWVGDFFGVNFERLKYNPFGVRRLYLSAEGDILAVRLAFNSHILKIQQVILRSEVSLDVHKSGEEAGGERCDSRQYRN